MTILGASVFYFYLRELLASFVLLGGGLFFLGLVALTSSFVWYLGKQAAVRALPASRNAIAFSHRLILAYAKH